MIRAIGVETGGSNVQFAVDPESGEIVVIEMNPRVSRSSALASKATGFPIAKMAAKLAVGYALEEIPNDITRATPASFEPTIDYVVTKIPRFAFEKFPGAEGRLSTHMQSVGEVMAIGRTFRESFAKAMRSRELDAAAEFPADDEELLARAREALRGALRPVLEAFRRGLGVEAVHERCLVDRWFLRELAGAGHARATAPRACARTYKAVDTCAAEFEAATPYYYSAHERPRPDGRAASEVRRGERDSVVILGAGPNRIGQGIEFDYCCVHAAMTARELGRDAVMVNCNPETVSTDYDTSDRLYFEPLTAEDVLAVCEQERPEGVIVQFGGQTPLKLARELEEAGVPLLGTPVDAIDLAEDRGRFGALLRKLGIEHPPYGTALSAEEAAVIAEEVGFPLLVRPSYVLGGRAMEICYSTEDLNAYLEANVKADQEHPLLLDRFLENAIEVDVDALADGESRARRRDHAARRGGRRPLRRLGLRAAADEPRRGDARGDPRDDRADRARAGRDRPDQHPVRGRRRQALRDRGQPARLAHRALRLQGDRRAAGQGRLPADAGRAARRAGPARRAARPTSASRRRCCPSPASPAPTRCSARR